MKIIKIKKLRNIKTKKQNKQIKKKKRTKKKKEIICLLSATIQLFSSECCEIFKNTYFKEHQPTAASDCLKQLWNSGEQLLLY